MTIPAPYQLDTTEAMIAIIIVTEAFISMPFEQMTQGQKEGVLLMFEQITQRALPHLPREPEMQYLFDAVERIRAIAAVIREVRGMDPKV